MSERALEELWSIARSCDGNGFNVYEFADTFAAELAAVAGLLDAAEGQPRIGSNHAVDECGAGLDFVDKKIALTAVVAPKAGAEAELCGVRDPKSLLNVVRAENRSDRSKELVVF